MNQSYRITELEKRVKELSDKLNRMFMLQAKINQNVLDTLYVKPEQTDSVSDNTNGTKID